MEPHLLDFAVPVTTAHLIVTAVCSGILFYGLLLYTYMAYRFRSKLYGAIALLALIALGFVGNSTLVTIYGAFKHMRPMSVHFHRLEQLFGVFFLFALPYSLNFLLKLSPRWFKVNRVITVLGLAAAVFITIIAFVEPDLFISFTLTKATWLINETDYGRGREGPVYRIRDFLLALYILYSISCIIYDIFYNKRFKELVLPASGILIAIYGAVNDMQYVYTRKLIDPFQNIMFSRFSLGLTIMVLLFMIELIRRFITSTIDVEKAHRLISASEKRYRFIIEETTDAIFALDSRLCFLTANRAAMNQLAIDRVNPGLTSLSDIVHVRDGDESFIHQVLMMKIEKMVETGKPFSMNLELLSRSTGEPVDYKVMFEYIMQDDDGEILVKASREPEDTLKKYIELEKGRYSIDNYLLAAEEISKRMVANIPPSLSSHEIVSIRLGLREILINAIEHGNLEIDFDEKTSLVEAGDYLQFLQERQREQAFKGRKIGIEFLVTPGKIAYKVTDEGKGFDHRKIIADKMKANNDMLSHGRGIAMAMNIFDEVTYNKKGNQVLLVKYLLPDEIMV